MNTIPMNPVVPAAHKINYLAVLSCLDNYQLPTTNNISEWELFNEKIYSWYYPEGMAAAQDLQDPTWFSSYE